MQGRPNGPSLGTTLRILLTGLSLLLIVALTAALVAPYLIDWNGQRAFIEARLSAVLGQKVTIGGNIDVKLLPTPYLVLGQTVIGSDDGPVTFSIHHLDPRAVADAPAARARSTSPRRGSSSRRSASRCRPTAPCRRCPDAPAFHARRVARPYRRHRRHTGDRRSGEWAHLRAGKTSTSRPTPPRSPAPSRSPAPRGRKAPRRRSGSRPPRQRRGGPMRASRRRRQRGACRARSRRHPGADERRAAKACGRASMAR